MAGVLRSLSFYEGTGRGHTRVVHLFVTLLGVYGMFAAILGALLTPWLVDAGNIDLDDDRFSYWVRTGAQEDDLDDHRACPVYREQKFRLLRLLDVS